MIRWIRAHFDGKAIVPDEPVDLPVNHPLQVQLVGMDGDRVPSSAGAVRRHMTGSQP